MKNKKEPRMTGPTLKALAYFLEVHPQALCGADIMNEKRILSGTLYPLLERLEIAGWLESFQEDICPHTVGRPRKKFYTITTLGASKAISELDSIRLSSPKKQKSQVGLALPNIGGAAT